MGSRLHLWLAPARYLVSPERARALNAWAATLTPQEATRARAIARNCGNCVHFEARPEGKVGTCRASNPIVDSAGCETGWPLVDDDDRCGRWNHPSLPLNYLSGLSPVELDQVALAMGVQIDG